MGGVAGLRAPCLISNQNARVIDLLSGTRRVNQMWFAIPGMRIRLQCFITHSLLFLLLLFRALLHVMHGTKTETLEVY